METLDLVVANAKIATACDTYVADIGICNGKIVQLGTGLTGAKRMVDAAGRVVTPGGVDSHVHIAQPMAPPAKLCDDFESGSRSAACGGTTTMIPFAAQLKGDSLTNSVKAYHAMAEGNSFIDYAFHLIISDPTPQVMREELPQLIEAGYTSFKVYMTYDDLKIDDGQMLEVLSLAKQHNAMTMVHAENYDCIAWLTKKLEEAGHVGPRFHGNSRPMLVEREATHRAISLAELIDTPILLVHISGREAVEQIRWAKSMGLHIYAETCPQYLFLTAEDMGVDDSYVGAKCVCSPPPRDKGNQRVLWDALSEGLFSLFSSDHCPFNYEGDEGKHPDGKEVDFRYIPNGIPGIETRLPLLYSEGVLGGKISLNRFVELTSTNPAKMYGLHPRKGTIAIGSDADLVIWDEGNFVIRNSELHHECDHTPYEGFPLSAWPGMTISNGEIVWDGKSFIKTTKTGRFLPCDAPSMTPHKIASS